MLDRVGSKLAGLFNGERILILVEVCDLDLFGLEKRLQIGRRIWEMERSVDRFHTRNT